MQKIFQVNDSAGAPLGGHTFQAPDETALAMSIDDFQADNPTLVLVEVESEDQLVIQPPPPMLPFGDEEVQP